MSKKLTKTYLEEMVREALTESYSKEHEEELKTIVGELEKASQMHASQAERIQKILDETNDDELKEENTLEEANCGCGKDPCETFGQNNEKLTVYINEEMESYMEQALFYGLIEEDDTLEEKKKKKKGCKPSKGKKYARRVKGKCVSYGAKGYKIAPGTSKGNSYCARSYGDMKSHGKDCSGKDRSTPLCLSRKKWKCSGKYYRKGK